MEMIEKAKAHLDLRDKIEALLHKFEVDTGCVVSTLSMSCRELVGGAKATPRINLTCYDPLKHYGSKAVKVRTSDE